MQMAESFDADVLLVEDDLLARRKTAEYLESEGFSCHAAKDGSEGLRQCLGGRYRLLLTDLDMPGISGLALVTRVRATAKTRDLPIIVLSGHDERETVQKLASVGIQGYLIKPVTRQKLIEVVRRHALLGGGLRGEATPPPSFCRCNRCGRQWEDRDGFVGDSSTRLIGYQANFRNPPAGLLRFEHASCKEFVDVEAALFLGQEDSPVADEALQGSVECPRYCLDENELRSCPAPCKNARIRAVLERILELP